MLIRPESHRRNKTERINGLRDKTVALLGEEFREYFEVLIEKKPRYVKEQLGIIIKTCEVYGRENTLAAMQYCQGLSLYSANDLRYAAEMVGSQQTQAQPSRLPVEDKRYHIPVQKRDLSVYGDVIFRNWVTK